MANGAAANERLSHFGDVDRREHTRLNPRSLQSVLQDHGVHHRGQHADIVRCRTVHAAGAFREAAKNVATTDDHCEFHSEIVDLLDFFGYRVSDFYVDAEGLLAHQRFT